MRIGIDARFLTHPQRGGFKTYSENLINALAAIDQENEYILYVDRMPSDATRLPTEANFACRVVDGRRPLLGMPWREQVGLSRTAAHDRVDLLHSPCLTAPLRLSCPSVVTIHDMIWNHQQQISKSLSRSGKRQVMELYYRVVTKSSARRAAAVITVSHTAKESIVEELHLPQNQIFVTYEAASTIFRPMDKTACNAQLRDRFGLAPDFVLAIGSADPRKNVATLLQAYAQLPAEQRKTHDLVIVWTHNYLTTEVSQQAEALGIAQQIRFLEGVSNGELAQLYNAAAVFVFPSREEGFGLPLLEAMSSGTAVVAADNSSIPEISGDAAMLVNAEDARGMATAIGRVLADDSLRYALGRKGLERSAGFTWARCAQETLDVYRQVRKVNTAAAAILSWMAQYA